VAFVIDVLSQFVVGWQTSGSLRSDLGIDPFEMAYSSANVPAPTCPTSSIPPTEVCPISVDPILQTARRERDRRVGRIEGRQLRQRPSRVIHRDPHVGTDYRQGPWRGLATAGSTMTYLD
jgi:hypothetical protein